MYKEDLALSNLQCQNQTKFGKKIENEENI